MSLVGAETAPTATHEVADAQDTALNLIFVTPVGSGVARSFQLLPFQRSASRNWWRVFRENHPTAMHRVADLQATPVRAACVVPAGLGVLWAVQVEPFQTSASVTVSLGFAGTALPTATQ
jgi:hypothetical protein